MPAKELCEPRIDAAQKPFSFDDIEERWDEFVRFFCSREKSLSSFITSVKSVRTHNSSLLLCVENDFCAAWIMDASNKACLEKSISRYVEVPAQFEIQTETDEKRGSAKGEAIFRRYNDLMHKSSL